MAFDRWTLQGTFDMAAYEAADGGDAGAALILRCTRTTDRHAGSTSTSRTSAERDPDGGHLSSLLRVGRAQAREVVAYMVRTEPDGTVLKEMRAFGAITPDIQVLADWLAAHEESHVAMESTGVYRSTATAPAHGPRRPTTARFAAVSRRLARGGSGAGVKTDSSHLARCRTTAVPMATRSRSHNRVEPSMSVKRNVTVPRGRSAVTFLQSEQRIRRHLIVAQQQCVSVSGGGSPGSELVSKLSDIDPGP